jgi:hypothetical protein
MGNSTPAVSIKHGTAHGYNKLGCRCPECTEAKRQVVARYREKHKDRPKVNKPGLPETTEYRDDGCRFHSSCLTCPFEDCIDDTGN